MVKLNARRYLEQVKEKQDFLELKQLELYRLKCLETKTTVPLKQDIIQSSGEKDKLGTAICERIVFEEEIVSNAEKDYLRHRTECIELLEQLKKESFPHYKILHLRYIEGYGLKTAAKKASYSYQRAKELHQAGIKKFQKILENSKVHT